MHAPERRHSDANIPSCLRFCSEGITRIPQSQAKAQVKEPGLTGDWPGQQRGKAMTCLTTAILKQPEDPNHANSIEEMIYIVSLENL